VHPSEHALLLALLGRRYDKAGAERQKQSMRSDLHTNLPATPRQQALALPPTDSGQLLSTLSCGQDSVGQGAACAMSSGLPAVAFMTFGSPAAELINALHVVLAAAVVTDPAGADPGETLLEKTGGGNGLDTLVSGPAASPP
jgi:hypothetical protein